MRAVGVHADGNLSETRNDSGRSHDDAYRIRAGVTFEENVLITNVSISHPRAENEENQRDGAKQLTLHRRTFAIQLPRTSPSPEATSAHQNALKIVLATNGECCDGSFTSQNCLRHGPSDSVYPQWRSAAKNQFCACGPRRNFEKCHCVTAKTATNAAAHNNTINASRNQPRPCPMALRTKSIANAGATRSNGNGSGTK